MINSASQPTSQVTPATFPMEVKSTDTSAEAASSARVNIRTYSPNHARLTVFAGTACCAAGFVPAQQRLKMPTTLGPALGAGLAMRLAAAALDSVIERHSDKENNSYGVLKFSAFGLARCLDGALMGWVTAGLRGAVGSTLPICMLGTGLSLVAYFFGSTVGKNVLRRECCELGLAQVRGTAELFALAATAASFLGAIAPLTFLTAPCAVAASIGVMASSVARSMAAGVRDNRTSAFVTASEVGGASMLACLGTTYALQNCRPIG